MDQTFFYRPDLPINVRNVGSGPEPLLFLHGFAAALSTWDDLLPLIPAERYTCHLLDLKGFGRSAKPRDRHYGLADQAAMVVAYLAARDLQGVTLVGHSLGGGVALLTQLQHPERVARLILLDAAAYPQRLPRFFRLLRLPFLGRLLLALVPVNLMVSRALAGVYHDPATLSPTRRQRYNACFRGTGTAAALVQTVRQLPPPDYGVIVARYGSIAVPTLIIWGEHDRVIRRNYGERLAADIPGARLTVIPGCGHNPHEERAAETWAAMAQFLGE